MTDNQPRFEHLWQHAPCGHVVTTAEDLILDVNKTLLDWTGYTRETLIGTAFRDLFDPGSAFFYETRQQPVLRLNGEVREVSLVVRRADGSAFPVLLNAVLGELQDAAVQISIFDASDRHEYERELLLSQRAAEASEERVRVLQDASRVFGAAASSESLIEALVSTVRNAVSATATSVMLPDADGVLTVVAGSYTIGDPVPVTMPSGIAYSEGRVVTVASREEAPEINPDLLEYMRGARFESIIAVPLSDGGTPLGVVASSFARRRDFEPAATELQVALARQATQALERIRLQEALTQLALHDQLTGLANRTLLKDLLSEGMQSAEDTEGSLAVIFLDLDGFKRVNDALGHAAGDAVLQEVGFRLRGVVRQGDSIGRFGGDEFVVVCVDADAEAALAVANRIRAAVEEPLEAVPAEFPVSASVGVAVFRPRGGRVLLTDELLNRADDAMYSAKTAGKNRVVLVEL